MSKVSKYGLRKADKLWEVFRADGSLLGYVWATVKEAAEAVEASKEAGEPLVYKSF